MVKQTFGYSKYDQALKFAQKALEDCQEIERELTMLGDGHDEQRSAYVSRMHQTARFGMEHIQGLYLGLTSGKQGSLFRRKYEHKMRRVFDDLHDMQWITKDGAYTPEPEVPVVPAKVSMKFLERIKDMRERPYGSEALRKKLVSQGGVRSRLAQKYQ